MTFKGHLPCLFWALNFNFSSTASRNLLASDSFAKLRPAIQFCVRDKETIKDDCPIQQEVVFNLHLLQKYENKV